MDASSSQDLKGILLLLGNIAKQRDLACLSREMPQQIGLYMQHLRKYSKVSNKRTAAVYAYQFPEKNPPVQCTLLLKTCKLFQHH